MIDTLKNTIFFFYFIMFYWRIIVLQCSDSLSYINMNKLYRYRYRYIDIDICFPSLLSLPLPIPLPLGYLRAAGLAPCVTIAAS